jgi:sulfate-transporting ATPase
VIVALLALSGRALPLRSHVRVRLPRLGSGLIRPVPVAALSAIAAVLIVLAPVDWSVAVRTTLAVGIVLLSITILTGYAGQVSLGQYALSGIGALIAGTLIADHGWPVEVAALSGVIGAGLAGVVFGLPALRTRGVNLAVITLALGLAVHRVLLSNVNFTGGISGTDVSGATLFGLSIDPITSPRTLGVVVLICFVATALLVARLRASRHGRQLVAIRSNERAAAAVGVNVLGAKLFAFSLAAGIAGLAGILLAFSNRVIIYDTFDPLSSIYLVGYATIGGLGLVAGSLYGGQLSPGALGTQVGRVLGLNNITQWLLLITGISLIVLLIVDADGMASHGAKLARKLGRLRPPMPPSRRPQPASSDSSPAVAATSNSTRSRTGLGVSGVTVRFGGVVAVSNVSLHVRPGEVLGVIGPNGAGKTTLIDAITGFVPADGKIELDGQAIHSLPTYQRSRAGISRSFQSLELFEDISIAENLLIAAERSISPSAGWMDRSPDWLRFGGPADLVIEEFQLWPHLGKLPSELPYGQRRLVAIARAMVARPAILLLDEPGSGLSDAEARELATQIRQLVSKWTSASCLSSTTSGSSWASPITSSSSSTGEPSPRDDPRTCVLTLLS